MSGLGDEQWQASVQTAQGRMVPTTAVPCIRSREVYVRAMDLATGLSFDLPAGFLAAQCNDMAAKRAAGSGPAPAATDTGGRWSCPVTTRLSP